MVRHFRLWLLLCALVVATSGLGQLAANVSLTQASSALLPLRKVQTELKLTPQQKTSLQKVFKGYVEKATQIQKTAKTMNEGMNRVSKAKMETATKAIAILSEAQKTRLRQIGMQTYGIFSALAPDMVKALGLTAKQIASLKRVQADTIRAANKVAKEVKDAAASVPQPKDKKDQKAVQAYAMKVRRIMMARNSKDRQRMTAIKKSGETKAMAVLTPAQRKQWMSMQGRRIVID